jgi:hypothetical protein
VNVTTENYALATTDALTAAGVDLALLPYVAGFCTAHVDGVGTGDAMERFRGGSLALPASLRSAPGVAGFLAADPGDCRVEPVRVARSYNAIQLRVRASRPSLVFVKDGWSPYWRASVNGAETDVLPALGAFKAVAVPAGASAVRLRFAPPWVGAAWLASYALLVGIGLAVWLRSRVGSRGLGQHSTNAV